MVALGRRGDEIGAFVIDGVDGVGVDELGYVERLGRRDLEILDLVGIDQDVFALLDLIALDDVVALDRLVAGHQLVMDAFARLLVDFVEGDLARAIERGVHMYRQRYQGQPDIAAPVGSQRHGSLSSDVPLCPRPTLVCTAVKFQYESRSYPFLAPGRSALNVKFAGEDSRIMLGTTKAQTRKIT